MLDFLIDLLTMSAANFSTNIVNLTTLTTYTCITNIGVGSILSRMH